MAEVVGVHGVGWHHKDRIEMISTWRDRIGAGLANERSPRCADFDLEVAFYGHLYARSGVVKGTGVPEPLDPGPATDLLVEMAGEPPAEDVKVYLPRLVQWAVRTLQSTDYFANLGHYALVRFANQVGRYFADPVLREGAQEEFTTAIGGGARVVVAHSLGSVIAYDVLRNSPGHGVDTLLTVGSPLGLRVIRERLGITGQESGNWPTGLRRWVNVAAVEDGIAAVKELEPLYCEGIEDRLVRNSRLRAHRATRYLSIVESSTVIADALS